MKTAFQGERKKAAFTAI